MYVRLPMGTNHYDVTLLSHSRLGVGGYKLVWFSTQWK